MYQNKVIMLMGMTASGKTDLAIKIANYLDVSIISVDSATIYRGMNIGTAKPNKSLLKKYPHELIDICNPDDNYSVKNFINDANTCIKNALANNKIPLFVGGSAFYFNALQYGLSSLPASTTQSREYFNKLLQQFGSHVLHERLKKIDKLSANKIHKNDSQRITRALEVYYLSGNIISSMQGNKQNKLDYEVKKIMLFLPKTVVHNRIEERFKTMVTNGLIEELIHLKQQYNLHKNSNSMRIIGYKEAWQYLAKEIDKEMMITKAISATKKFYKRQNTWFKNEQNIFITDSNFNKIIKFITND